MCVCVCVSVCFMCVCVVVVVVSVVVKRPAFPLCAVVGHSRNPHNDYYRPLGFLVSNDRQGIFNVHDNPNACCAHKGKTGSDETTQHTY